MGGSRGEAGKPDEHDAPSSRVVMQSPKATTASSPPDPKITPHATPRVLREALRDAPMALEKLDHPTRRDIQAADEASTRIVAGDPLANITRRPTPSPERADAHAEPSTRAWGQVEGRVRAYNSVIPDDPRPFSRSPSSSVPSSVPSRSRGMGGASHPGGPARDERVAAMRELYARGDAEGALVLAADISDSLPPLRDDLREGSSAVEGATSDYSFEVSDPFGGLVVPLVLPENEQAATTRTVLPPPVPRAHREEPDDSPIETRGRTLRPLPKLGSAAGPSCAAPRLSLTERHSIPVLQKTLGEVAASSSRRPIDHRAGFLLTLVDGMQTLEEILDICAMPAEEALELIEKLKAMGVLAFE